MPTPDQITAFRRLNDTARSNPGTGSIANVTSGFYALPDLHRVDRQDGMDGTLPI